MDVDQMNTQPKYSAETNALREKIRLKKLDREIYVHEREEVMRLSEEERRALRIGNLCLIHMTRKENKMPYVLNAKIFEEHPLQEKLCMKTVPLQESIVLNDSKLFKLGKRLLKQDFIREQRELRLSETKYELEGAKLDTVWEKKAYDTKYRNFLHKQVMVEDSGNRELSAKLTHQRLQKILDELNMGINEYNVQIQFKERQIVEKTKELHDFLDLRDRAKRYLAVEMEQLKPVNKELTRVSEHFDKLIYAARNEMDDRRKKGALGKFLAEREVHQLSFGDSCNFLEIKFKNRNKSLMTAYDTILALQDAMMVSDIENVVDCFLDQNNVSQLLSVEREEKEQRNKVLKEQLKTLKANNDFLKFDASKLSRFEARYQTVVVQEADESKEFNSVDYLLKRMDKNMTSFNLAVHALLEKLRPIKLEDPMNKIQGDLLKDFTSVVKKTEKMQSIIEGNTIPIGRVKPIMLHMFQEKRLPPDYIRVEMSHAGLGSSMSAFETFEADQPGLVTREMLKVRAAESGAGKKKGKGGKDNKGGKGK